MISAIVINWNGRSYLRDCIQGLLDQVPPPDEIVLVDNHSEDGSRELVSEQFPGVRIVDTGANLGASGARNIGLAEARHELCLLVDNDVVLEPGCLSALSERLAADRAAALVQARSLCADRPEVVHYDAADLHYLGLLVLHNWFRPLEGARDPAGEVGAVIALCLLCRRDVLREVGGFDERLFILFEDSELSWALRMHGHRLALEPRARCLHHAGTAGLSMRGPGAVYSARRVFLHARNRWIVLLTCMRWRTLLLTLPAQLAYSAAYLAFALSLGHLWAGLRGHLAVVAHLPGALRRRARVQRGRRVADRALLVSTPTTPNPGLADRGFTATVRRSLDRGFGSYWRVVRRLCG